MGRSCILDPPPGRGMPAAVRVPAVVRMPACHFLGVGVQPPPTPIGKPLWGTLGQRQRRWSRHFACGRRVGVWMGGCPIAPPPPPRGGGAFVGLWVCQKSVVGGSLKSPPAPPPPPPVARNSPGATAGWCGVILRSRDLRMPCTRKAAFRLRLWIERCVQAFA